MGAATLSLPTVRSEIDKRWISQKIGMIGPPGIGKSKFWSFCNGLYLQTEAGLNHLAVMKMPVRSWGDFRDIYSLLVQSMQTGKFPYDTVIIDTMDKFVDLAQQEAIERGRNKFKGIEINSVGDIPNGAGWAWSQDLVENALAKLEELPCAVVYVGHLEVKEVKEPTRSIHKQTISIGGKMGGMLTAWPDHLLNVNAGYVGNELKRVVRTLPSQTIEAKSREGMVKDGWQWTNDDETNWKTFRALFN